MRIPSLLFKALGLLAIYAFACGALAFPWTGTGQGAGVIDRLAQPFLTATPLALTLLAAAIFSLAAGAAIGPRPERWSTFSGAASSWPKLLLAACTVNGLVVVAISFLLISGSRVAGSEAQVGALFAAGVFEAVLGVVLAFGVVVLARPGLAVLPSLGLLLVGIASLGTMFWLGRIS